MPIRTRQPQQQPQRRRQRPPLALPAAETMQVLERGQDENRRHRDAVDAYEADMTAAFRVRADAIDEAWSDYQRKYTAADIAYDQAHTAAAAAYDQRTGRTAAEPGTDAEPADVHR